MQAGQKPPVLPLVSTTLLQTEDSASVTRQCGMQKPWVPTESWECGPHGRDRRGIRPLWMDGAEADGVRVEDTHPFPDRHHHPHFAGAGASCAESTQLGRTGARSTSPFHSGPGSPDGFRFENVTKAVRSSMCVNMRPTDSRKHSRLSLYLQVHLQARNESGTSAIA